MSGNTTTDRPCYSISLVKPFVTRFFEEFGALDPDSRIPMAVAHDLLKATVEFFNDPDFGLKAGRAMCTGDVGALDYALDSSATVRESIEVAARYIRLINDGLDLQLEFEGDMAIVRLETKIVLPRYAEDFQLSAFYTTHSKTLLFDTSFVEFWFVHPKPEDISEYKRTFGSAVLRFSAPYCGIAFKKEFLDLPIKSADSKLHSVIRKHAELMLGELPKSQNLTEKVRELATKELSRGQPKLQDIARRLSMSSRTLGRRLEEEGTTFSGLLDDLRQRLSYRYLNSQNLSISEIAFLLGFSHTAAFHRAFKRWTDQTPLEYRRTHRRSTSNMAPAISP